VPLTYLIKVVQPESLFLLFSPEFGILVPEDSIRGDALAVVALGIAVFGFAALVARRPAQKTVLAWGSSLRPSRMPTILALARAPGRLMKAGGLHGVACLAVIGVAGFLTAPAAKEGWAALREPGTAGYAPDFSNLQTPAQ